MPCPPELAALLRSHLAQFGTTTGGLLFGGIRGGQLSESTYCRVWRKARTSVLTPEEAGSEAARQRIAAVLGNKPARQ